VKVNHSLEQPHKLRKDVTRMATGERLIGELYVEYDIRPEGESRHPLLYVHGAWTGSWIFSKYLGYLAAGGWNGYAMNLRGHYKSAPCDLTGVTLRDYAHDVIRIARHLPVPPVLVGFGTGALIVQLALSMNPPAAAAVFISAKLANVAGPVSSKALRMPPLIPAEPIGPARDLHPETLAWLNEQRANSVEPRSVLVGLLSGQVQTQPDFVKVPYLVLNGESDEDISPDQGQELAAFYEGRGTLDLLPEASHTGILVGAEWEEGANAINAWLGTNGFAERDQNSLP
jgi:pimeloyl-ACP methyl ester carboxylesterase